MKKSKKIFMLLCVVSLVVFSFIGCTPDTGTGTDTGADTDTEEKMLTIGFIPMTLNNEYFITMVNGAEMEANANGVELLVQAGERHGSAEEQLQIVESMITRQVDAICIVPSSSEGLSTAIKKAQDAGIPVINLDTRLDGELLAGLGIQTVPFFGTDNYEGAKLAGEMALEILEGSGKVAILTGIEGQENAAHRRNGFYDVVKDKLEVVAEQTANWEVEQGYNVTQNILQANPELDLIFASNDGMAIGALRAVKEAGRDIQVIGFDAINEALNSVEAGDMLGTVAQFPAEMGIEGVRAAIKLANGESVPEYTSTGAKLITSENVAEFKTYLSQFTK
jgi:ribose transport system substrate-binding protein